MKVFLFLVFFSAHALAADFSCSASLNGKEILSDKIEVTENSAEIYLGTYKDVELIGNTIMGQVSAFMIFDGVMFGSISMNSASYTMFRIGEGELSLFCHLDDSFLP